jgi:flavin reductase (DIM6/NTAB) family NADH-FMN oxidoreductase RutF
MSAPDPDLRARFLAGMSHAAATVNVVTTDGPAGRAGVTVSAMASVSADTARPTLLVCVHRLSPAAAAILGNGVFCVNVLRDDQAHVSDAFAGRGRKRLADRFEVGGWVAGATGAPRLADPLVAFDCRVVSGERVGTHHVLFGEVAEITVPGRGSPLIYAGRAYGRAARIEPSSPAGPAGAALRLGCFHTFGPFVLPGLLARMGGAAAAGVHLVEGDHRRVLGALRSGEVDLALVYDFDPGPGIRADLLAELAPYVALAEGHPLAARAAVALADLAPLPMVLLDAPPSADYFLGLFAAAGLTPRVAWRSTSFEMVRGLVARGLGYALLATRPAAAMSYDGSALVARPLAEAVPPSRVVLAARDGAALPPAAEGFALLCRELFEPDL